MNMKITNPVQTPVTRIPTSYAPPLSKITDSFADYYYEDETVKIEKGLPHIHQRFTPVLTAPQNLPKTEQVKLSISIAQITPDPLTNKKKIELELDMNEAELEKQLFEMIAALRLSKNESIARLFEEIQIKQLQTKDLHSQTNELKKYLEEHAKTSGKLNWVERGTTGLLVLFTVACFAASVATGGVSAVLGSLAAVAGTANGVMGGVNGFRQLKTQEIQGLALELKEVRELENGGIEGLLNDSQDVSDKINELWNLTIQILRNRALVNKMS